MTHRPNARSPFSLTMLLALLLLLGACGKSDQPTSPTALPMMPPSMMPPTASLEPVRIGVIVPLSGSLAPYGQTTLDGINLMAERIRASGGIGGRPLELIVENNEGDTTKSSAALRKLVGLKKALAIIGPITSTNSLAIVRDAQNKGITLISPTATNDTVTGFGDYIFRACFNDSFQGVAVAKFAVEDQGIETAISFKDTTSDYSIGLCESFSKTFAALGGQALPTLSYKQGDTEFTAQLRKVRESGAEALFIPGYPPELSLIINEARSLGLETTLLGADGWDNDDVLNNAGENLVGAFFAAAFSTDVSTPELDEFLKRAADAGIGGAGSFEALGYDSLGLIAAALEKVAGTAGDDIDTTRRKVRDALAGVTDYRGATGPITMQSSGDPLKSLVVLQYDDSDGQVVKSFVKVVNP